MREVVVGKTLPKLVVLEIEHVLIRIASLQDVSCRCNTMESDL